MISDVKDNCLHFMNNLCQEFGSLKCHFPCPSPQSLELQLSHNLFLWENISKFCPDTWTIKIGVKENKKSSSPDRNWNVQGNCRIHVNNFCLALGFPKCHCFGHWKASNKRTSTTKFLWAAQDKRFKKIQTGTLPEPSGTFSEPSVNSNNPWTFGNLPWTFRNLQEPSLNLQEPSLNLPWTFRDLPFTIRNPPWTFPEPSLNLPWTFPEPSMNLPWTFNTCPQTDRHTLALQELLLCS